MIQPPLTKRMIIGATPAPLTAVFINDLILPINVSSRSFDDKISINDKLIHSRTILC